MFGGDWAAFLLVALVVGLYCVGELCQITFENRGGRDAPIWIQSAMLILGAIRQYCFLPVLCRIVAMLVLHRGSDAISICFNGVAVLFLLGIDVARSNFGSQRGCGSIWRNTELRYFMFYFMEIKTHYYEGICPSGARAGDDIKCACLWDDPPCTY
jgi:hypothetical protein